MITREDFEASLQPWLRLSFAQGVGALRAARLLAHFGSPERLFAEPADVLQDLLANKPLALALATVTDRQQAAIEQVFDWLNQDGQGSTQASVRAVWTRASPAYPPDLAQIEDPPLVLYVVGPPQWVDASGHWWQDLGCLAVVGSRQPTAQGTGNARQFSAQLRRAGACVVSGLARGIDAAAHEGALDAERETASPRLGGPATVAVMATGIDRIYPSYHQELAHRIAANGLVLSEQPLGAPPMAGHFPKRNRIITGMCQATLVVEATEKSGSLVSARLAVEQGREVMAIPGSIHAPQSKGCHVLIKQGAKLVESPADVLDELRMPSLGATSNRAPELATGKHSNHARLTTPPRSSGRRAPVRVAVSSGARPAPPQFAPERYADLLQALAYDPISLEELMARTGMAVADLQARLLELELDGGVARLPGGLFQRLVSC